jgi:hypothetical protein
MARRGDGIFSRECFSCGREFEYGRPGKYDGKLVGLYQLWVCSQCYKLNEDGWSTDLETKILAHLAAKGRRAPGVTREGISREERAYERLAHPAL